MKNNREIYGRFAVTVPEREKRRFVEAKALLMRVLGESVSDGDVVLKGCELIVVWCEERMRQDLGEGFEERNTTRGGC